jgi:alpha-N-arabinofuranosidase
MKYKNPIIPGYNPDPSICRVGEDFYLVNSTFEFFPGVPIYHSKNLANWQLAGYCLTRRSQLELEGCRNSGGIYAPTIRHHHGMFYMITTNVTDRGNFIVHTDEIGHEWSDPVWVDQSGIDPSLFWDEDDSCYYCSTGVLDGVRGIVAFKINPMTGEIRSDKKLISTGCGGQCAEGPHIYKINNYYYLMIAEGGTEYAHREIIQRSSSIWGPYEACPHNPIISHKEYKKSEIQATGHADLVSDQNGNWWLVCLGIRRFSHALLHNLGRETFLAPVTWDSEGWPVVGYNGNGTIELEMDAPLPGATTVQNHSIHIDFHDKCLDHRLFFTRNPKSENYIYNSTNATVTLKGTDITINEPGTSPTIVSFKQPEFTTTLTACLNIDQTDATRCGVAAYYNNDYHYEIYIGNDSSNTSKSSDISRPSAASTSGDTSSFTPASSRYIGFYKHIHDMGVELARIPIPNSSNGSQLLIKIDTDREKYTFSYAIQDESHNTDEGALKYTVIGSGLNAGLSTEGTKTMTFTGTLFSLFCENGTGVFSQGVDLVINPDENYTL